MNKLIFIMILLFTAFVNAAFDADYSFKVESATQVEIDAIVSPQNGMMVYNTDDNKIHYYNGTSWSATANSNIYNSNGQLSANREVDLNSYNLGFMNGNMGIGDATPDAMLDVAGSFRLDGIYYDKDGDPGTVGQVLTSTATGTNWISITSVPYISNPVINVPFGATNIITLFGSNFLSTSTVSISGFDGSINSAMVISPSQIELNITAGAVNTFDIVVSNTGILNTGWTGNGVGLLKVSNNNGQTQSASGITCKSILDDGFSIGDGTYWINPDGGATANAFQVYCDMTEDGGGWTLVFRHDVTGGYFTNNAQADSFNEASPGLTTMKYSILNKIDSIKSAAKYEFRLYYPTLSKRNHWKQTFDPRSGTSPISPVLGYAAINIDSSTSFWGGLDRDSGNNTFLDGSVNHSNWWYSIGSKNAYQGGVPGPSSVVNIVELFIR